jgi:hypothetical protein
MMAGKGAQVMSKFDIRNHQNYRDSLEGFAQAKLRPLVNPAELDELNVVAKALPRLEFPINSAGEMLDQLGSEGLDILGMRVDPARMIKYMPAYYFPVASYENLVEKMAELVRANRRTFDAVKYREKIHKKMRRADFPIRNADELRRQLRGVEKFNVAGMKLDVDRTLEALPESFFPVQDLQDFESKAMRYLSQRPLIEAD